MNLNNVLALSVNLELILKKSLNFKLSNKYVSDRI